MTRLLAIVLLFMTSCAKTSADSRGSKGATTEQPTEVSGGFGLTMQCSVVNRGVPDAGSSEIACIVSNDDGTKYTGDIKDIKAAITAKNSKDRIQVTPVLPPFCEFLQESFLFSALVFEKFLTNLLTIWRAYTNVNSLWR